MLQAVYTLELAYLRLINNIFLMRMLFVLRACTVMENGWAYCQLSLSNKRSFVTG